MERELILERTRAGLEIARCQRRIGGRKPDDRQQGSGRKKAIRQRDAAVRGGAQLRRVDPYVISMGARVLADVRARDRKWSIQ